MMNRLPIRAKQRAFSFSRSSRTFSVWEKYEQEMAGEPAVYKFMNQLTGKESSWEEKRKRHY